MDDDQVAKSAKPYTEKNNVVVTEMRKVRMTIALISSTNEISTYVFVRTMTRAGHSRLQMSSCLGMLTSLLFKFLIDEKLELP